MSSIAQKHYQVGYSLYMGGHPLSTCQNAAQVRGWWAALDASAEAAIPGLASRMGW